MESCWDDEPKKRPTFAKIVSQLDVIIEETNAKKKQSNDAQCCVIQ